MKPVIYIDQTGQVMFIKDCPEEPKYGKWFHDDKDNLKKSLAYDLALAAAKQSAIRLENQAFLRFLLCGFDNPPNDFIYPIPDQYKVEIIAKPIQVGCEKWDQIRVAVLSLKPQEDKLISEGPIHLKDLALTTNQFLTIKNYTVNNGEVMADKMMRDKDDIQADFFHSKETNEQIAGRNAVDLILRLLKQGVIVRFNDNGESERIIAQLTPPLYDKYYRNSQTNEK